MTYRHFPQLASKLFNKGSFDKVKLLTLLPKDPIILEIGASVGLDTVQFRGLFPKAVIHAFEPVPSSYTKLLQKTKGLNIYCHKLAFGSITGKSQLFISSGGNNADSSSLLKPTGHITYNPQIKFNDVTEVDAIRPEEWLRNNSIDHIDFLWLDTQGTELDILKNCSNFLDSVKIIHLEVSLVEHYANSALYQEVQEFLTSKGFSVFQEIFGPNAVMGDVVFTKK